MSVLHHLGEDGISGNSPAPPRRKYCYLHLIFRRCCLKHSNFAPNSLLLNILPTSPMGSIFCGHNYILDKPEEKANTRN